MNLIKAWLISHWMENEDVVITYHPSPGQEVHFLPENGDLMKIKVWCVGFVVVAVGYMLGAFFGFIDPTVRDCLVILLIGGLIVIR